MERHYPSDVSDAEWALLEPFFISSTRPPKLGRRETGASARRSFNAIRYLLKTGWLPTVHDALTRWTRSGLWERINTVLREQRCSAAKTQCGKKNATPSAAIIDSQSVKCADTVAAQSSGYDACKKIKGRKRHILTDTQGNSAAQTLGGGTHLRLAGQGTPLGARSRAQPAPSRSLRFTSP